jgi:hypothetical protein
MAPIRPGPHGGGGTSRARVERLIFIFLFMVVVVSKLAFPGQKSDRRLKEQRAGGGCAALLHPLVREHSVAGLVHRPSFFCDAATREVEIAPLPSCCEEEKRASFDPLFLFLFFCRGPAHAGDVITPPHPSQPPSSLPRRRRPINTIHAGLLSLACCSYTATDRPSRPTRPPPSAHAARRTGAHPHSD